MSIARDPKTKHIIKVAQHGYIKEILSKHNSEKLSKFPQTPASPNLCRIHDENKIK